MEEGWKVSYFYRSILLSIFSTFYGCQHLVNSFWMPPCVRINDLLSCFEKSIALYCKSAHILSALFRSNPKRYLLGEDVWDGYMVILSMYSLEKVGDFSNFVAFSQCLNFTCLNSNIKCKHFVSFVKGGLDKSKSSLFWRLQYFTVKSRFS